MTVAYDAFIDQVDHNLETASEDLEAAATGDNPVAAIRQLVRDACGKAKMLWTGSPEGTILRNKNTGVSATRIINDAGIPQWEFSGLGAPTFSHEPVLLPEADWVCIYDPEAT